jgi:hypothetical protein
MLVLISPPTSAANRLDLMAPRRTGAKSLHIRVLPGLMRDLDAWIASQPGPRLLRVEAVRQLLTQRLAGPPAPAPAAPSEDAELRRQLIRLAGKVDGLVAYTRQLEAERDALAARAARAERAAEAAQQSARETANVVRWPADGRSTPYAPLPNFRGSRSDPEAVARARAQIAEAEARAAARAEAEAEAAGHQPLDVYLSVISPALSPQALKSNEQDG